MNDLSKRGVRGLEEACFDWSVSSRMCHLQNYWRRLSRGEVGKVVNQVLSNGSRLPHLLGGGNGCCVVCHNFISPPTSPLPTSPRTQMATAASATKASASASGTGVVDDVKLKPTDCKKVKEASGVLKLAMKVSHKMPKDHPHVQLLLTTEFGRQTLAFRWPEETQKEEVTAHIRYKVPSHDEAVLKHATIIEWVKPWMPNMHTRNGCVLPTKWALLACIKTKEITSNAAFWQWQLTEYNHYDNPAITPDNHQAAGELLINGLLARIDCDRPIFAEPHSEAILA